jgi:hypothetical protein
VLGVSLDIAPYFCNPIICVGFRGACNIGAAVPMPKTAVNENDFSSGGKNEIGFSGQILSMETEAIPETMNQ